MMLKLKFTDCRSNCFHYVDERKVQNYGQLREGIAAHVEKELSFKLSLNYGKDHIHVDDATTLKDLGLVPGDVLTVVICSSADEPDQFTTKGLCKPVSYMDRIMLCCESKTGAIPKALENLYLSQPVETKFDALVIVIHRLMGEVGFLEIEADKSESLLSNWHVMPDVYKMNYRDPLNHSGNCQLVCVVLGENILMVSGIITVGYSRDAIINTSLHCNSYLKNFSCNCEPRNVYINLSNLSQCFKDNVALPLMNIMRMDAGMPTKSDFTSLPMEMKLLILNFLDAPSLAKLSQVCTELNQACSGNILWKKCAKRELPKVAIEGLITSSEINWKKKYIQIHQERRWSNIEKNRIRVFQGVRPYPFPAPYGNVYHRFAIIKKS